MKKHFLLIASLICFAGFFSGCNVKDLMTNLDSDIKITLYGNVSDAITGEPLSDVSISAVTSDGYGGAVGKSVTGADGNYEMIVNSSSFTNVVRAEKAKYETKNTKIEISGSWEKDQKYKLDIQMRKEAVIYKGVVKDSKGFTIDNAKIEVKDGSGYYANKLTSTFTDQYGEYTIEVPRIKKEGEYQEEIYSGNTKNISWTNYIEVSKIGYTYANQSVSHNSSDLGKSYTINFVLTEK